ncbi:DUF222 domain-containing protein [Microbacterium sp. ZW T5_45]|uniref:HNH endonuclease signature motif containing protein n=1 Tax=Microbacterium sp. ZW T5_45 TaxID=3378080 RepID=UPI003852F2A9
MDTSSDLDLEFRERERILASWVETREQIAALEAVAAGLLIEQMDLHDRDVVEFPRHREAIFRSMVAEFSAAGHVSKGSMEYAFTDARRVRDWLPAVRAAAQAGTISAAHVREIARASEVIAEAIMAGRADAALMGLFEAAVLPVAETDTASRTRVHGREVASSLVGETVVDRHKRAARERSVTVRSLDDGLAILTAVLPEWIAVAIQDRITRMSQQVIADRDTREPTLDTAEPDADGSLSADDLDPWDPRLDEHDRLDEEAVIFSADGATFTRDPDDDIEHVPADTRSLDEVRADVFTDLLLAGTPGAAVGDAAGAVQARIQVTVAATTLAGADDRPAQLDGYGELDPDIARDLAGAHGGWTRLFLDPTGLLTHTDTYTPTAAMRRYLRARDQHCRFPGCQTPVHRCDIDHNQDHARGGATSIDNLAHFCRSHHTLKHPDVPDPYRWTAQQHADGTITWHSPLHHAYTDRVPRRVMFT